MVWFKKKTTNEGEGEPGERGSRRLSRVESLVRRGTLSNAPSIREGYFGGSRILKRQYFDWIDKPWYIPLDPFFFFFSLAALIGVVYSMMWVMVNVKTEKGTAQAVQSGMAAMTIGAVAAWGCEFTLYLLAHLFGAKSMVGGAFVIHLTMAVIPFVAVDCGTVPKIFNPASFVIIWPFMYFKWPALTVANAHIRVWKEVGGDLCCRGYGYNMAANIILINVVGYIFMLVWSTGYSGYIIVEWTTYRSFEEGIVFALAIAGWWGAEALKNIIFCTMGILMVVYSKTKEDYAVCTLTSARVWVTHFGSVTYAALIMPVIEPLYGFCYWTLSGEWCTGRDKGGCTCTEKTTWNVNLVKHFVGAMQELTTFYNYKGLVMTTMFGVSFQEGSDLTSYIPKEENPIWAYLTSITGFAGASVSCWLTAVYASETSASHFYAELYAFTGWVQGWLLGSILTMGLRGSAEAFDFLRHDDVKTIRRGNESFMGKHSMLGRK